jgi:hypothetical protein
MSFDPCSSRTPGSSVKGTRPPTLRVWRRGWLRCRRRCSVASHHSLLAQELTDLLEVSLDRFRSRGRGREAPARIGAGPRGPPAGCPGRGAVPRSHDDFLSAIDCSTWPSAIRFHSPGERGRGLNRLSNGSRPAQRHTESCVRRGFRFKSYGLRIPRPMPAGAETLPQGTGTAAPLLACSGPHERSKWTDSTIRVS